MKEIAIAFVIALCFGAVWNSMRTDQQQLGVDQGAMQPGLVGQELIAEVDKSTFQGMVMDAKEPVLVEFYTDTCTYCKTMAPILGRMAIQGDGILRVCKINLEKNQSYAEEYNVQGVPTFVLFRDGQMVDSIAGAKKKHEMRAFMERNSIRIPTVTTSSGMSPEG